jgi:hypothetical protein
LETQGILAYDSKAKQHVFRIGEETAISLNRDVSRRYIRELIDQGMDQSFEESVNIPGPAGTTTVRVNTSAQKIVDLGINYMEASQIDEITHVVRSMSNLNELVGETRAIDENRLLSSIGKTYEHLSQGTPFFKAVRGEAEFTPGMRNATAKTALELAKSAIDIGSPHVLMTNQARMFSTIVSQATSGELESARQRAIAASSDMNIPEETRKAASEDVDFFRYAKNKDLMSEYGVSHFKAGKKIDLVRAAEATSEVIPQRIIVPMQIVQEALGDEVIEKGNFSLSVAKVRKGSESADQLVDQLNVYFHLGQKEGQSSSREVAQKLYDYLMNDKTEILKGDKTVQRELGEEVAKIRTSLQAIIDYSSPAGVQSTPEQMVELLAQRIDEGGIGVAYAGPEETARFVRSARASGIPIDNDVHIRSQRSNFVRMSSDKSTVVLSGFENENVMAASQESAEDMSRATAKIRDGALGEVSDAISSSSKETQRILRMRQKRRMIGMQANEFIESLIKNKGGLKAAAIGMTAAAAGYYIYRRSREDNVYDDTIDEQPIQQYAARFSSDESVAQPMNTRRRDPLVTAGVVGNLDRNKIGHYRMGNDKYNNLYSGV